MYINQYYFIKMLAMLFLYKTILNYFYINLYFFNFTNVCNSFLNNILHTKSLSFNHQITKSINR